MRLSVRFILYTVYLVFVSKYLVVYLMFDSLPSIWLHKFKMSKCDGSRRRHQLKPGHVVVSV